MNIINSIKEQMSKNLSNFSKNFVDWLIANNMDRRYCVQALTTTNQKKKEQYVQGLNFIKQYDKNNFWVSIYESIETYK